jgi:hypothetical protein
MHATLWALIAWLFVRGFSRVAWWLYRRKPEVERTVELRRDASDLWIDGLGHVYQVSDRDIFATLSRVSLVRLPSRAVHFVPTHALRTVSEGTETGTE